MKVTEANLRMYNVGFGDCFLLVLTYDSGPKKSLLFDFGSTRLPNGAGSGHMKLIADDIATLCGGKLDVVVVSHRHADHLSGFGHSAAGPVIAKLKPDLVVQPWTEAPDLAVDALAPPAGAGSGSGHLALSRRLSNMQQFAAGARTEGVRLGSLTGFPVSVAERLTFMGETNLKNDAAVRALMELGKAGTPFYAKFGDTLPIDNLLPGVTIEVLGPPTLEQAPTIASEARTDADEFWHLAAVWGKAAAEGDVPPAGGAAAPLTPLFPGSVYERVPQSAKWLVPQISRAYAEDMLSILRIMDDILNNTSLILLMHIGNTSLLFPGDAQIENWSYALFDAPNSADIVKRLRSTNVYKVGHHGSLNATPKTLWNGFSNKGPETKTSRLITAMSTKSGKHGDYRRGTEVPRTKLVDALELESHLFSTQLMRSLTKPWRDVDIPIS